MLVELINKILKKSFEILKYLLLFSKSENTKIMIS